MKATQSCLTLCDPRDCSLTGSSVRGIFQARVLEWVAIAFSRGSSWPRDRTEVSCIAGRCFTIWATREIPLFPYWNFFQFWSLKSSGSLKFSWLTFGSKIWSERMWCYLLSLSLTLAVWPPEHCVKGILAYLTRDRVSDSQRWHNVIYDFCAWISFKRV